MSRVSQLLLLLSLLLTVHGGEKYCIACKALVEDAQTLFGCNFTSVSEISLTSTTSSLCRKYYVGFEEVICRLLCQVNAEDLLEALRKGVPIHTICQKGGVCNDFFKN